MSNAIALNISDEQKIRRRHLPLELQCELFSALPLEHASRLLLLSDGISNNCISRVRKQREKWQEFSDRRVNELVKRYHPWLPAEMRAIEKAHLKVNLEAQQKDILDEKKRLSHDRAWLSPWVGVNSVLRATGAVTRDGVMAELQNSIYHMHRYIERNENLLTKADEQPSDVDRTANRLMSDIVPVHFTNKMLSAGNDLSAERLRRAYLAHLDAIRARLIEIKRAHREKLRQTGGYTPAYEWSSEVKKHRHIIMAQWQTINMQNEADEFDATVWRERFLDELKAKNALTVESSAGDAEKCPCLLGGEHISRYCSRDI